MGEFCIHVLRLRYPSDPTDKTFISVTSIAPGRDLQPQEAYDAIHAFKSKITVKRSVDAGQPTNQ